MKAEELFPIVNESGCTVGSATRSQCHSGSMILHPVVHLHIVTSDNKIYLQRRSLSKDIQPGKWDTAVGGHVDFGEAIVDALHREAREELGITFESEIKLMSYVFQSEVERELVNVFMLKVDEAGFTPILDKDEVIDGRFWSQMEVQAAIGKGILTPNFEQEFLRIKQLIS